jgi:hypothetical protein
MRFIQGVRKDINFFNCTWVFLDVFEAENAKRLNFMEFFFLANYRARGTLKVSSTSFMESRIISFFAHVLTFLPNLLTLGPYM